jgi:hypothetical protein
LSGDPIRIAQPLAAIHHAVTLSVTFPRTSGDNQEDNGISSPSSSGPVEFGEAENQSDSSEKDAHDKFRRITKTAAVRRLRSAGRNRILADWLPVAQPGISERRHAAALDDPERAE